MNKEAVSDNIEGVKLDECVKESDISGDEKNQEKMEDVNKGIGSCDWGDLLDTEELNGSFGNVYVCSFLFEQLWGVFIGNAEVMNWAEEVDIYRENIEARDWADLVDRDSFHELEENHNEDLKNSMENENTLKIEKLPNDPPFCVIILNLLHTDKAQVAEFFRGLEIINFHFMCYGDTGIAYSCIVEFADFKSMEEALSMNGKRFYGRQIRVEIPHCRTDALRRRRISFIFIHSIYSILNYFNLFRYKALASHLDTSSSADRYHDGRNYRNFAQRQRYYNERGVYHSDISRRPAEGSSKSSSNLGNVPLNNNRYLYGRNHSASRQMPTNGCRRDEFRRRPESVDGSFQRNATLENRGRNGYIPCNETIPVTKWKRESDEVFCKLATNDTPRSYQTIFGEAKPVDTAAREREIEERLSAESVSRRHSSCSYASSVSVSARNVADRLAEKNNLIIKKNPTPTEEEGMDILKQPLIKGQFKLLAREKPPTEVPVEDQNQLPTTTTCEFVVLVVLSLIFIILVPSDAHQSQGSVEAVVEQLSSVQVGASAVRLPKPRRSGYSRYQIRRGVESVEQSRPEMQNNRDCSERSEKSPSDFNAQAVSKRPNDIHQRPLRHGGKVLPQQPTIRVRDRVDSDVRESEQKPTVPISAPCRQRDWHRVTGGSATDDLRIGYWQVVNEVERNVRKDDRYHGSDRKFDSRINSRLHYPDQQSATVTTASYHSANNLAQPGMTFDRGAKGRNERHSQLSSGRADGNYPVVDRRQRGQEWVHRNSNRQYGRSEACQHNLPDIDERAQLHSFGKNRSDEPTSHVRSYKNLVWHNSNRTAGERLYSLNLEKWGNADIRNIMEVRSSETVQKRIAEPKSLASSSAFVTKPKTDHNDKASCNFSSRDAELPQSRSTVAVEEKEQKNNCREGEIQQNPNRRNTNAARGRRRNRAASNAYLNENKFTILQNVKSE
ncbi:hypothetical protein T02_7186 [Trichinella nativa]|uniref:RRM domain-containing protein n=1 Tax=Trichinella nativa TaxID=6335 RepID=A0A0V1LPE7_9BILA|nr:hypothetical protein T02_7186 [Trichinella nativa]